MKNPGRAIPQTSLNERPRFQIHAAQLRNPAGAGTAESVSKIVMKRMVGICLVVGVGILALNVTLVVVAVRASLRKHRLWARVAMGCHSDALSLFEYPLREWAQTNGNVFPSAPEFLKSSSISNYAFCRVSDAPLVWNPQLHEISLTSGVPKALAWCPLGSHERFTCALIAEKGKVWAEVIEWNRLSELLATNSPR